MHDNASMAEQPKHYFNLNEDCKLSGARAGRRRKLKKSYEYEVRWAGAFSHPEHDTWLTRDQCAPAACPPPAWPALKPFLWLCLLASSCIYCSDKQGACGLRCLDFVPLGSRGVSVPQ